MDTREFTHLSYRTLGLWAAAKKGIKSYRGKKSKSVFDFLTYSRKTWFSFSYEEVGNHIGLIEASNEIERVGKSDNSLSFGAKLYNK